MSFDVKSYLRDIEDSKNIIKSIIPNMSADVAIVLWSWLWDLTKELDSESVISIPYNDIKGFPKFHNLQWHSGELLYGTLAGKKVLLMSWRYHYYEYADESHAMKKITLPIRLLQALQIPNLILSNAVGSVNQDHDVWDIMIIKDHINMMGDNPLLWKNIDELGPRFPNMTNAYDTKLRELAKYIAIRENVTIHEWIYLALSWPNYETQAEYDRVKRQWADTVWMSVIPEVLAARHSHHNLMNILGLNIITNKWWSHIANPPSHEEVIDAANVAMPKMITLVKWIIEHWEI